MPCWNSWARPWTTLCRWNSSTSRSGSCSSALLRLCDTIMRQSDQRLVAMRQELGRGGHVNLNVRAPKRASPYAPVLALGPAGGRPLPIAKFLGEKQRMDDSWGPVRRSFVLCFSRVALALKKKKLAGVGLRPEYVEQNHRPQLFYTESDRPILEEAWSLTSAHREELFAQRTADDHNGGQ